MKAIFTIKRRTNVAFLSCIMMISNWAEWQIDSHFFCAYLWGLQSHSDIRTLGSYYAMQTCSLLVENFSPKRGAGAPDVKKEISILTYCNMMLNCCLSYLAIVWYTLDHPYDCFHY